MAKEIVEIQYYNGITGDEKWDGKIFPDIPSAKRHLRKNGFKTHKGVISKTRYFDNGHERYLFAYIICTYKNDE